MLLHVMVRRLTVLQNQDTDDALAARRPRWQWVSIGAGFVITLFLPLSWLGVWLGAHLARGGGALIGSAGTRVVLGVLPVAICFLIACTGAGALVGRFGGRAKAPEAALAGAFGAAASWALALFGGALSPWVVALAALLALVNLGAAAAFLGAQITLPRRV